MLSSDMFLTVATWALIIGAVALVAVAARGFWVVYRADPYRDQAVAFEVVSGASLRDVRDTLEAQGLLRAPAWFLIYGRLHPRRVIQAGAFQISRGESIRGLYDILTRGEALEREITMIEGWTIAQLAEHLVARNIATAADMNMALSDPALKQEYAFLATVPAGVDLEGYLFPETYRVLNSARAGDIVRRLLDEFEVRVVEGYGDEIARSGHTLHEVVTWASLLEREVRRPEDMAAVSDVIRKRLEAGMPLQLDATVNYATGKRDASVTLEDTQVDSPYNTYRYAGLPVGPIANPGEAAIQAALRPSSNPYYFYLTTKDGAVVYARTHDEHVRNKARYLR